MKLKMFAVAASLGVFVAFSANAQEKPANREIVKLEQLRDETEWKIVTAGGAAKSKWLLHERKIDNMVERLKAGRTVDPKEIDQLLNEHYR